MWVEAFDVVYDTTAGPQTRIVVAVSARWEIEDVEYRVRGEGPTLDAAVVRCLTQIGRLT